MVLNHANIRNLTSMTNLEPALIPENRPAKLSSSRPKSHYISSASTTTRHTRSSSTSRALTRANAHTGTLLSSSNLNVSNPAINESHSHFDIISGKQSLFLILIQYDFFITVNNIETNKSQRA